MQLTDSLPVNMECRSITWSTLGLHLEAVRSKPSMSSQCLLYIHKPQYHNCSADKSRMQRCDHIIYMLHLDLKSPFVQH